MKRFQFSDLLNMLGEMKQYKMDKINKRFRLIIQSQESVQFRRSKKFTQTKYSEIDLIYDRNIQTQAIAHNSLGYNLENHTSIYKLGGYLAIILLMRTGEVSRSQQYSYFLNKSIHYDNLRHIKPVVADKQSPKTYRYSVDEDGFARNRKFRKSFERTRDLQNQQMMTRILKIIQSPRTEVQVQGYSKYNEVKRNFMTIKKDEIERSRNIGLYNLDMADRITNTKAMVGSLEKWNQHYQRFKSQARNASRFNDNNSRKSRLEIHGPHLPHQISGILDEKELKSLKSDKKLSLNYDRLFVLPELGQRKKAETSWLHRKSQTIDVNKSKDDFLEEPEKSNQKTIDPQNPAGQAASNDPAKKE